MNYRCSVRLGNSSTASSSCAPGPELQLGLEISLFRDNFTALNLFTLFSACHLLFFFGLFSLLLFHAQVFGKTLVHEFPFFYGDTEWNLLSSLSWNRLYFGWGVLLN